MFIPHFALALALTVGPTDLEVLACPVPDQDPDAIVYTLFLNPDLGSGWPTNPGCSHPEWNDVCWAACHDQPTCYGCCEVQFRNAYDACWTRACQENAITRVVHCKNACYQAEATGLYD